MRSIHPEIHSHIGKRSAVDLESTTERQGAVGIVEGGTLVEIDQIRDRGRAEIPRFVEGPIRLNSQSGQRATGPVVASPLLDINVDMSTRTITV